METFNTPCPHGLSMAMEGVGGLELLVAAGEQSFAATLADRLEATDATATATVVDPADAADRATAADPDGVVVGSGIRTPTRRVGRLVDEIDEPVVLLADADSEGTVDAAIAAGVADVFPRTAARRQCARVVHRVATLADAGDDTDGERPARSAAETPGGDPSTGVPGTGEGPYRELFENVGDGLVVHEPETGEILDVNERFCEMNGYDRAELVGEEIGLVTAPGEAHDETVAREMIERARREGTQLFEWRNQRRDGETFPVEVQLAVVRLDGTERVLTSVRDITERKSRERELEEQRRLYGTLVEQSPNGVMIVQDGEIAFANPEMSSLTGYAEDDLLGRSFSELVTPEYRDLVERRYEQRTRGAGEDPPENYEIRTETAAGGTRTIDLHVSRIQYRGAPATLATFNDVTALRRCEREARESERRLRLIAEHIDEIIYLSTADFSEILYINPAYEEIYGQPVDELSENPRGFVEAAHPDDRARYEADVAELVDDVEAGETRAVYEGEYRLTVDDEIRWVRVGRFPVTNEEGVVDRIVGRVQDVTERRRREREFEQIFDSVHDAIVVHDPETKDIVDANDTFCELLGYDYETVLDLGTAGFSVSEAGFTRERAEEIIEEVAEDGERGPFEWQVETSDGEHRILETYATMAEIGGQRRVLSINRDITEQRRREREFEQIFNGVQGGITINDPETGEILDVNESFCELLGYDREAILEMGNAGISVAEEGFTEERAREIVGEVVETGEPREFEWAIETADGETRWLEVRGSPAIIGGEERYVSVTRDVTERRRREHEYEQLFHGVTDAIAIQDPETAELLDANRTFVGRLGYDALDEVLQEGVAGLSATDAGYTEAQARELCHRVMETGEPETVEWTQETRGGDRLLIEATVSPAVIGGEDRVVSIQRDVTERRRLEQRFRTIAERVEEIIYLANADLTEVRYVNDSYADIYGRSTEELYEDSRAFLDAVHPDDRETYEAELEAMLADIEAGDPDDRYEFEFRIQRPDGEVRWLEATGYPILDATAQPHQFVGVVTDVTERHQREQTLETFHEATRKLTAADDREAACRRAVQAAEDVLEFPLVSAYLYDEEQGTLEPTAMTARLADPDTEPASFGPGDSIPWQVFVEGEAVTSSEPTTSAYGPGVPDPDIVLPLGTHGVMLVGAPHEEFDAEAVELAQILAATLEAALNHVAGERALAEREAELRRQQERADRLERLNTIIRDIEQATVEQSSQASIEEAVCDRLVDVEQHDLVWVAEPTVGDDGLVPRTSAGGAEGYVDGLTSVVGSSADPGSHPAVAAYRNDDLRAVENVATDVSGGAWRKHALGHGIQSVVAVPVRYRTTVHSVLTVASAEPDAFGQATRDVLAELGRSIGYAITVTEREQALESDGTTELEFAVADEGLFMMRAAAAADCRVELKRTIRRTGGSFSMFYVVSGTEPAAVVDLADAAPSVATAQVVSSDDEAAGGLVEVTAPTWFGSVFTEHGAVVREATAADDGGTLVVEAPRGTDVRVLVEGFQEQYPGTELVAQRQRERTIRSLFELQDALETELTDRQWEALETAYSAGYFSWPREASGQEVAELLGVSQPTFNKHLRIAERSAFQLLLERESLDDE